MSFIAGVLLNWRNAIIKTYKALNDDIMFEAKRTLLLAIQDKSMELDVEKIKEQNVELTI